MFAYDGGPTVEKAVTYLAASHASFAGLELQLLWVGSPSDEATSKVERAVNQLRSAGFDVQSAIDPGHPEAVIAHEAESDKIDLLVMGAYGHLRIRNLIIGSTTTEMIRSCKIPVVLFR